MNPLYFGSSAQALLGMHHEPADTSSARVGVVLCAPAGHEQMYAYQPLRLLAEALCARGVPVLRFDYFGCGDSSGDASEGSLARWREDIAVAAQELRDLSAVEDVSLLGMRLGATLAAQSTLRDLAVRDLVLWCPVVSGRAYLDGLAAIQVQMAVSFGHPDALRRARAGVGDELLGFPLDPAMRRELLAIEPAATIPRVTGRVLTVGPAGDAGLEAFYRGLQEAGLAAEWMPDDGAGQWGRFEGGSRVAAELVRRVADWLAGVGRA